MGLGSCAPGGQGQQAEGPPGGRWIWDWLAGSLTGGWNVECVTASPQAGRGGAMLISKIPTTVRSLGGQVKVPGYFSMAEGGGGLNAFTELLLAVTY